MNRNPINCLLQLCIILSIFAKNFQIRTISGSFREKKRVLSVVHKILFFAKKCWNKVSSIVAFHGYILPMVAFYLWLVAFCPGSTLGNRNKCTVTLGHDIMEERVFLRLHFHIISRSVVCVRRLEVPNSGAPCKLVAVSISCNSSMLPILHVAVVRFCRTGVWNVF